MLMGEEQEYKFILPNGHGATISCGDSKKFAESTQFVVTSRGYESEEEAIAYAEELKESVLCFGAKYRVGIDAGKDMASGAISNVIISDILHKHGVRMVNDVHGISVYDEEYPISCVSVSSPALYNPREMNFFIDELCKLISTPRRVNSKIRLAIELLTSSYFEKSARSRFLTLISAAEALLEPDDRSDNVKLLIDELRNHAKSWNICDTEKSSILGSLNWLYKDSISQALRKMADNHLSEKTYDSMSSREFIKKCYEARSKLVHTGDVDESKYSIGGLAANLEVYLTDMLTTIVGI
jgi:hypothetical protein